MERSLLAGIVFIISIVRIQSRSERADRTKPADEEWSRFRDPQCSRSDFQLLRLMPSTAWSQAEFFLEDEQRTRIGSFVSQSRVRADLQLHGKAYQMYIQRSGAFASSWAGKVGGTSDHSIVIRTSDSVVTELIPIRKFPAWSYSFTAAAQDYTIAGGGWLPTKPLRITRANECVGIYVRDNLRSRKVLVAVKRDLPDSALLAIMVAALLQ